MKKSKKESTRKREIVRDGKSRGRTEREREREKRVEGSCLFKGYRRKKVPVKGL